MSVAEQLGGARALRGDERGALGPILHGRVEVAVPAQRVQAVEHGPMVGRIADDQVAVIGAVDDQVVDDPAVGVAQHRVLGLARLQRAGVADHRVAGEGQALRTGDQHLAHVRQVEQADRAANGPVLVDDRARTGPASPSRRTAPCARRAPRAARAAGCAAGPGPRSLAGHPRRGRGRLTARPGCAARPRPRPVQWHGSSAGAPHRPGTSRPRRTRGRGPPGRRQRHA